MIIVYGLKTERDPIKKDLSDIIHRCMMFALDFPEHKRVQRFIGLEADDYYYPTDRTKSYTIIEINMMSGRSVEAKKLLIRMLFDEIYKQLKIKPSDIEITIKEQPPHCWGFRGMTGDEANFNYNIKR